MPDEFLTQARQYVDAYGWSILPVTGKKPNIPRWAQFQRQAPCSKELADMFGVPGATGLAVVAGPVSAGLVVRDFDAADSYRRWAAEYSDLAAGLPTVQTARGYHVLFRAAGIDRITSIGDGELRGNGYSLLPTSLHPSGQRYTWLVQPGEEIPFIADPARMGFGTYTDTCNGVGCGLPEFASGPMPKSVEVAVAMTLPMGPGQRNRRLFDLARALKSICPEANAAHLRMILADWHRQALPFIRTKDFQETLTDFVVAWRKVRSSPLSLGPIVQAARDMPAPAFADVYDEPTRLLVRLCCQLQRQWGERPFFLSARKAGQLVGVPTMTAWRAFQLLVFDGVLRPVELGTLPGRRATQWHYLL